MATAIPERSLVRAELAALLTAGLTGPGHLVKAVFKYAVKDFSAKSPVLVIGSAGTDPKPFTMRGSRPGYLLDLWVFVLYASVDKNGALVTDPATNKPAWTESDSQDTLDLIEAQVRELLDGNQKGSNWKAVNYAAPSDAQTLSVGDQSYRAELIPLRFETF